VKRSRAVLVALSTRTRSIDCFLGRAELDGWEFAELCGARARPIRASTCRRDRMSPSLRKFYAVALYAAISFWIAAPAMAGGGDCAEKRMSRLDAEGTGTQISASEHAAQATKRFESMDANKDGRITTVEIGASHGAESAVWAKRRMSAAEKIAQLDADRDGALTSAEYAAGSQKMFEQLDSDGDGTLTAAEMRINSMTSQRID
jgi:hypothetical protein